MTRSMFWLAGGCATAVVVAGGAIWYQSKAAPSMPVAALSQPISQVAPAPEPTPEAPVAPEPEAVPTPAFTVVRIDPNGSGLVSGTAPRLDPVQIMLGKDLLAEVAPDANGSFVAFVDIAPSDSARRLSLRQGDVVSEETVIVAPFAGPDPEPAQQVAMADPAVQAPATPAEQPEVQTPQDTPTTVAAPTVNTAEPASPSILISSADGPKLLAAGPDILDDLSLDTITYSTDGDFVLGGRATGAALRVYLDNRPVSDIPVSDQGDWRASLPEVDEGVYILRVDSLDAEGEVVKRIETPVRRQDPAEVARVMAEETANENFDVAVRTVQPGNSLWAIAEETYGDGIMYVQVFEANADLIRNPDLIYPGQVFRLPKSP